MKNDPVLTEPLTVKQSGPSPVEVMTVTWFGSGLLPMMPGTWGTIAALPFAWALQAIGGQIALAVGAVIVFFIGWVASNKYEQKSGSHDPGLIVIDEVAGMWLTLLAAPPSWLVYLVGFFLFRLFDVLKPFPIGWVDRRVAGGFGVMIDDVLAAGYAAAILYLIVWQGWI